MLSIVVTIDLYKSISVLSVSRVSPIYGVFIVYHYTMPLKSTGNQFNDLGIPFHLLCFTERPTTIIFIQIATLNRLIKTAILFSIDETISQPTWGSLHFHCAYSVLPYGIVVDPYSY